MKVTRKDETPTHVHLEIEAEEADLVPLKDITLKRLQKDISAPGFRKGKVPLNMVEKQVDPNFLQNEYLNDALQELYMKAIKDHNLRVITQPQVNVTKFVPYSELIATVHLEVIADIKLGDYKKKHKKSDASKVDKKEVDQVIENLRLRTAEKKEVKREAKDKDEVLIDFEGHDEKGKAVAGASGQGYPLVLGSDTFIKGFEPKIVGMKAGEEKKFTLTFPEDYAHQPLAGKKVNFKIKLNIVNEVILPKVDSKFAASVGPFTSVDAMTKDIQSQLEAQKLQEADAKYKDDIIGAIVESSTVDVPKVIEDDNVKAMLEEFKQNLSYRGMTFEQYLEQAKLSEEDYVDSEIRPVAIKRAKTGLVLSEIADKEKITVTPEELEVRLQVLKGQYPDEQMQSQFDSDDARRDVASRLLTEKTINKLVEYASK